MSDSASNPSSASNGSSESHGPTSFASTSTSTKTIEQLLLEKIVELDPLTGYRFASNISASAENQRLYAAVLETANKKFQETQAQQLAQAMADQSLRQRRMAERAESKVTDAFLPKQAPETAKPVFPTRRLQIADYLNLFAFTLACVTLGVINYGVGSFFGLSWDWVLTGVLGVLASTEIYKAHCVRKDTPENDPSKKRNYRFAMFAGICAAMGAIIATSYHLFLASNWGEGAGVIGHAAKAFVSEGGYFASVAAVQFLFTLTVVSLLVNAIWDFVAKYEKKDGFLGNLFSGKGFILFAAVLMGIALPFGLGVFPASIFGVGKASVPVFKLVSFLLAAFGAVLIFAKKLQEPRAPSADEPVLSDSANSAAIGSEHEHLARLHAQFQPLTQQAPVVITSTDAKVGQRINEWFTGNVSGIKEKINKFITDTADEKHAISTSDGNANSSDSSDQLKGLLNSFATGSRGLVSFGASLKDAVRDAKPSTPEQRRRVFIDFMKTTVRPHLQGSDIPNFDTIFAANEIAPSRSIAPIPVPARSSDSSSLLPDAVSSTSLHAQS